tara:strand:+ start:172 stop:363 length:192 start_codon:yes stop_codon:yes gene_type:complete
MKRFNRHERAVERKLDEIIKLLTTQPRNTEHDDERMAIIKEKYKESLRLRYEAMKERYEDETN